MKKTLIQNKSKDNYAPGLPEEQINKIVQELSDPNLSPVPYSANQAQALTNKAAGVVSELMSEYNRKVIEIIEKERKEAFQAGVKEEKKTS